MDTSNYSNGIARAADELAMQHILLSQRFKGNNLGGLKGRVGILFEIECPFDFVRSHIKLIFIGHEVYINNKQYVIKGVNCPCIEKIAEGTIIGLLVEEK